MAERRDTSSVSICTDLLKPVYLHFLDAELAACLRYAPRHPQSREGLTALALATVGPLYAGYSLPYQWSLTGAMGRALRSLYNSGQLSLYTSHLDIDAFRRSRIEYFQHAQSSHEFYFADHGDAIANTFDAPTPKTTQTTQTITSALVNWSELRRLKNEHDRVSQIIDRGLASRGNEGLTIELFVQKSGLSDADQDIQLINYGIIRTFIGVYLNILDGALITGLKRCDGLDSISCYCPFYDYRMLSYAITALFGDRVLQSPASSLAAAACFRLSTHQVSFAKALALLLVEIYRIALLDVGSGQSDASAVSMDRLRKRMLSTLALYLGRSAGLTGEINEQALERATGRSLDAWVQARRFSEDRGAQAIAIGSMEDLGRHDVGEPGWPIWLGGPISSVTLDGTASLQGSGGLGMTQESPMGLGVEQRLRQLERNIEQTQVLLSRLEEALLYETHPIRQSGYENNIASLQQRIATYRREHSELGRLVTRDQVEQSNHISKELEDLQAGIDRILAEQRVIGRSIGQLQRDLADQFDARVQGALSTIVRRLDQSDLLTVTVIEHAIESATVPIAVMTDILQHVWIELSAIQDQTLAQDKELSDGIGKLAGIVNDPELSVSHKLKVTIPIIPFVMQYEGHVDIGSKLRLRAAWEKLVRHTSGGEP